MDSFTIRKKFADWENSIEGKTVDREFLSKKLKELNFITNELLNEDGKMYNTVMIIYYQLQEMLLGKALSKSSTLIVSDGTQSRKVTIEELKFFLGESSSNLCWDVDNEVILLYNKIRNLVFTIKIID